MILSWAAQAAAAAEHTIDIESANGPHLTAHLELAGHASSEKLQPTLMSPSGFLGTLGNPWEPSGSQGTTGKCSHAFVTNVGHRWQPLEMKIAAIFPL